MNTPSTSQPDTQLDITLYEFTGSRSGRCRWTLFELGLDYHSIEDRALFHSEELKKLNPMGKLPVAVINGKPLFESAAICTYLADLLPEKGLIAASGTYERGLHEQWVSFCLTEMEAYLWSNVRNTIDYIMPKEKHVPAIIEQNNEAVSQAVAVLEKALQDADYLIGNRFSVTDIIVSFTVSWANSMGFLKQMPNLQNYLARLYEQPNCTLQISTSEDGG